MPPAGSTRGKRQKLCDTPEKSGDLDAFPPGLFLSVPRAKSASGVAVVDGSITQVGRLTAPVTMSFDKGRLVAIEGGSEPGHGGQFAATPQRRLHAAQAEAVGVGLIPGRRSPERAGAGHARR